MYKLKVIDDGIHFTRHEIASYGKPFNYVISPRDVGKSKELMEMIRLAYHLGLMTFIIRRQQNSISKEYLRSIAFEWNKFYPDEMNDPQVDFEFKYSVKDVDKKGITTVNLRGRPCFVVAGLSAQIANLKSLHGKYMYILFDEFICNPKYGEHYLHDEPSRLKDIYDTYVRDYDKIRVYLFGNPYSLFNPYFLDRKVKSTDLYPGAIIVGKSWVIQCYQMHPELREKLSKKQIYQEEDDYTKYAFDGRAVNDSNIRLASKIPQNFSLRYVINVENTLLGIYRVNAYMGKGARFYVGFIDKKITNTRDVYAFTIEDLVTKSILLDRQDKLIFSMFKYSIRNRDVLFQDAACYYLIKEVYQYL